jgi:hypothetical protein
MGDGTSRGRRRYGIVGLVAAVASLLTASLVAAAAPARAATPVHAAARVHTATMSAGADAVIHVATTGHDTASCGRVADPCQTIPYAYGKAAHGDTIQVAAGTYTLGGPLRVARPGIRLLGAMAGVNATTRIPGRPGKAAAIIAGLKRVSIGALLAGPFFAPVNAFLKTIHGHVSLAVMLAKADLDARNHWSSRQQRPQQICVGAAHRRVCLHVVVHPEASLHVTKAAMPNPAHTGRPVTFTITVIIRGPADAFGLAGAGPVHLDLRRHHPAGQGLPRVRQQRLQPSHQLLADRRAPSERSLRGPQHRAHRPAAGTTDHGCTPTCSAPVTVTRAPIVPVTG